MYANQGDTQQNIPPHWHYIRYVVYFWILSWYLKKSNCELLFCSFGLSDLHGDGRVHEVSSDDTPSGFGFELTFRLKREPGETSPPTWPAALMQALAKYVFQSGKNELHLFTINRLLLY